MGTLNERVLYTFEEFEKINNDSEKLLEFIDGQIYALASPSRTHQVLLMQLSFEFRLYFKNKECKVYAAPIDIKLTKDDLEPRLVIPDLVVTCDRTKWVNDQRYEGIPSLIVEILSPSNRGHDTVTKINLYAGSLCHVISCR